MKIEVLYPEVCCLYGELANPRYLALASGAELIYTRLSERPRFTFEDVSILVLCSASWSGQRLAVRGLRPWLYHLVERTRLGGVTLFTGSAFEILGQYVLDDSGTREPMLGLLPFYTDRHFFTRYNAIYLGLLDDIAVAGHKSSFGHSHLLPGAASPLPGPLTYLFKTLRGCGLDPDTPWEGMRSNNLLATSVSGPLIVQNPPLARYLLDLMGAPGVPLPCRAAAWDSYRLRIREFSDPRRGVIY